MSKRQNNNPVDGASGGGGNGKRVGSASGTNSPAQPRESPMPTQNARANNANAVGNNSPSHSPLPPRSNASQPNAVPLAAQAHAQHRENLQQAQATGHVNLHNASTNHSYNHSALGPSNRNVAANCGAVGTSRSAERTHASTSKNNPNANRQRDRARDNEREVVREHLEDSSPEPSPQHEPHNDQRNQLQANHLANAPIPNQVLQPPPPVAAQDIVPHNWQATKTTIKDRLAFMFNSEVMADVHFLVGKEPNSQRIPAHKFVLSIGSAVFDAMFNGGMATTSEEVELPDVEPAAFLALLRFLYSDEVQIGPETVMTTLYTAKKYAVPALERACVDFLKRNLSSDNAFMLLTQARLFDEPQLAALCLETIDKNTTEALSAEGFTDIDLETLCVVLERDTLGIRECKLFGAVSRWSEAECMRQELPVTSTNQRLVLGRALPLIRFPLMTVEEYAIGAAQSGILTDREVVELFLYFTVNPKPATSFLSTPRCCLTGKEQVVSRFCEIESRWGYSGTSDRIRFMVNRRIFVVGLGLYGSIHGPSEYQVNIQIIHTDTGKICGQNDTTFQSDGSTSTFRVMFKEPAEIQPNISYTSCATLKGPDSYYGTKGLRKVTHESVTSGRVTFQFTYAAGNNNGTSVEDGQLPEIIFYT